MLEVNSDYLFSLIVQNTIWYWFHASVNISWLMLRRNWATAIALELSGISIQSFCIFLLMNISLLSNKCNKSKKLTIYREYMDPIGMIMRRGW